MNTSDTHFPSRPRPQAGKRPSHQAHWTIAFAAAGVAAFLLSACGTNNGEAAEAATVRAPASEAGAVTEGAETKTTPTAEPTSTPTAEPPAPTEIPDADDSDDDAVELAVTGTYTFEWTPLCQFDLFPDPALEACETSGNNTYLQVLSPGTRTGTFQGADVLAATFVVSPDGEYVFAGPGKFEGSVEGCGEGTVIYTAYGFGQFGTPDHYTESIYTPTKTDVGTLGISIELSQTFSGSSARDVTGTYDCALIDEPAVRPDAGVDADSALEMTGPVVAVFTPQCDLGAPLGSGEGTCNTDGEHWFQPVLNRVTFIGSFEGTATFVGTQIFAPDGFFEHSGMFIFEGTVEGCGEGTVILVNEANGRNGAPALAYHRAYTPVGRDSGTIGVRADLFGVQSGPTTWEMTGVYSCD